MKLEAYVGIGCSAVGEVEGETLDDCIEEAWEVLGSPFLCHLCSRGFALDDAHSLILTDENGVVVFEESPNVDEARRTKGLVDYIEELKAEIVKLKEDTQ